MARPSKETPVASPLVPALLRYLRAHGKDATLFAIAHGLGEDAENREDVLIAPSAVDALLEDASALCGEPHLALQLPSRLVFRTYRFGEISARASATLREGLTRLARYAPSIVASIEARVEATNGEFVWRMSTPDHPRGLGAHTTEYALALAFTYARRESAHEMRALRVWFSHARPRDLVPLHRFFGTQDLVFGAADSGFALSVEDADRALIASDGRLLATVEALAEAELRTTPRTRRFDEMVAARIETLLPDVNVESVSMALHMSARTLQRRLEESGSSFSDVLDSVRETKARQWIGDHSLTMSDIAYRLGFADLASFGRAFKRWTGMPPGTFRRR